VGLRREHNEDCYATWSPETEAERERRGELLVVADGMGGSAAGEVASRTAVEVVMHHFRTHTDPPDVALTHALEAAHHAVHRMSVERAELAGMGTTCTAIVVRGAEVRFAHVGDSRAYLVRERHIRQLTVDHSLVAQLVQQQLMTPEQARVDPRRNVLTRSIGVGESVEVDGGVLAGGLRLEDTLLLCSDGLHGLVSDEELASFASRDDLDDACAGLIGLARERGGHDNITVVLARPLNGAPNAPGA
jgi:protein phosphatase